MGFGTGGDMDAQESSVGGAFEAVANTLSAAARKHTATGTRLAVWVAIRARGRRIICLYNAA